MTFGALAALVAALALVVLVLFLIPTIISVKRTAESVAALADLLTNQLKPTIVELNAVLVELKTVGSGVAEHTDDVKKFMSALGETGSQISTINRSVGLVTNALGQTGAWVTGAKVAGKYLLERYLNRKLKGA
jgi:uncharacterized protein YoxC